MKKRYAETRVVLVTGAGSGIGRAVTQIMANDGWAVLCVDLNGSAAEESAAALPDAFSMCLDVRDEKALEHAVAVAMSRWKRLDAAVAAAGVQVASKQTADRMTAEEFRRVVEINLTGAFLTARAAARAMIATGSGGRIVLVGSIASQSVPMVGLSPYAASKGGLLMLGRSLAVDWAAAGICVNVIGPGIVETSMTAATLSKPSKKSQLEARIPLGRIAGPEDIAGTIRFLLSDESRYMTGTFLPVDGGWLAGG